MHHGAAASLADGATRVALGCVDAVPVALAPAGSDEASVAAADESAGLEPPSDVHGSADYRRHLAAVCSPGRRRRERGGRRVGTSDQPLDLRRGQR